MGKKLLVFDVEEAQGPETGDWATYKQLIKRMRMLASKPSPPYFDVRLQTNLHKTDIRFSRSECRLVGYRMENCKKWLELRYPIDEHEIPKSYFLELSDDYDFLVQQLGEGRTMRSIGLGQQQLTTAVNLLATSMSFQERAWSVIVVNLMISEGIRFKYILDYIAATFQQALPVPPWMQKLVFDYDGYPVSDLPKRGYYDGPHSSGDDDDVKDKTLSEINSEAEKSLGQPPGTMRSGGRGSGGALGGPLSLGGVSTNRPGRGGVMHGMPLTKNMRGGKEDVSILAVPSSKTNSKGRAFYNHVPLAGKASPINSNSLTQGSSGNSGKSNSKVKDFCNRVPLVGKASLINSNLLPQGSSGLITGETSALLQGSGQGSGLSTHPSVLVSCPGETLEENFGILDLFEPVPPVCPGDAVAQNFGTLDLFEPVPPMTLVAEIVTEKPGTEPAVSPSDLHGKTVLLLEDYFRIHNLDEAVQCIVLLGNPKYHPEVVKEAINIALHKGSAYVWI